MPTATPITTPIRMPRIVRSFIYVFRLSVLPRSSGGHGRVRASLEYLLRVEYIQQLDQLCHHPSPAGLVAGTQPGAIVAVEILVEEDIIAPVWIGLEFFGTTVDGSAPLFIF